MSSAGLPLTRIYSGTQYSLLDFATHVSVLPSARGLAGGHRSTGGGRLHHEVEHCPCGSERDGGRDRQGARPCAACL